MTLPSVIFLTPGVIWIAEQAPPPVSARMVYVCGDYYHSLACFEDAKRWAKGNGAWTKDGLYARIYPPDHELCPASCPDVPEELLGRTGWSVSVDFYCDTAALEWLLAQPLPENARLVVPDGEGEANG